MSVASSSSLLDDVIVRGGEGATTARTNDGTTTTNDAVVQQAAGQSTGEEVPFGPPSVARLVSLRRNNDHSQTSNNIDGTVGYTDPTFSATSSNWKLYTTQSWYPPALVRQRYGGTKLQNHRYHCRALLEQPVLEVDEQCPLYHPDDDHNDNGYEAYHQSPRRRRSAVKRRVCPSSNKKTSSTKYLSKDYKSQSKTKKTKKCLPPTHLPLLPTSKSLHDIVSTPVRRQFHHYQASSTTIRMNRLLLDNGVDASFVTMLVPTKHDGPSSESYSTPPLLAPKTRRQRLTLRRKRRDKQDDTTKHVIYFATTIHVYLFD